MKNHMTFAILSILTLSALPARADIPYDCRGTGPVVADVNSDDFVVVGIFLEKNGVVFDGVDNTQLRYPGKVVEAEFTTSGYSLVVDSNVKQGNPGKAYLFGPDGLLADTLACTPE